MMRLTLRRLTFSPDCPTKGTLYKDGVEFCKTLERPWLQNRSEISCIPDGVYKCSPWSSAKFPDTWIIRDVPLRSSVLFHAGNTVQDTHGCVLVGDSFDGDFLKNSRATMDKLRHELPTEFEVEIVNP